MTIQAVVVEPFVDTLVIGQRVQLVAATHASSGAVVPNRGFAWTSLNDAVASVTNAGLVTGIAEGTTTIRATSDSVAGTATITVSKP